MKLSFPGFAAFVVASFLGAGWLQSAPQEKPQAKPAETASAAKAAKADADGKTNPVKATPENLAAAKKFFGFDCAMCHGAAGDGKGDLAASMGLKMNDWREASRSALTDPEIYDLIVKGKGKMIGEGDRYPAETVWELVNYVRTLEKKETAAVPKVPQ
jgi:mono/diheme cytochrome c family protein